MLAGGKPELLRAGPAEAGSGVRAEPQQLPSGSFLLLQWEGQKWGGSLASGPVLCVPPRAASLPTGKQDILRDTGSQCDHTRGAGKCEQGLWVVVFKLKGLLLNNQDQSWALCFSPSRAKLSSVALLPYWWLSHQARWHFLKPANVLPRGRACSGWPGPGEAAEDLLSGRNSTRLP